MTRYATVPLQAYDIFNRCLSVPCFVCGQANSQESQDCRYCQTPLAISHQTNTATSPPQMLAVIGAPSSGKTVYLGMLTDMLSRQSEPLQLVARGAISVAMQQTTMSALSKCRFPPATEDEPHEWNWMHCQIQGLGLRRSVELIVPDMSGNALAQELEAARGCLALHSILSRSAGAIIILDAAALAAGDQEDVFFALRALSHLCELPSEPRAGWNGKPVAIVLTKADMAEECWDDPDGFLRQHAPALNKLALERLKHSRVFASSVVGGVAFQHVRGDCVPLPLRIEPRGIVEPFQWVVGQIARMAKKGRSWFPPFRRTKSP